MTVQTKPAIYYFLDELGSNQHPDPANMPQALNGYHDEDIPLAREYNTYGRGAGLWHRWLDQNALTTAATLSSFDALLTQGRVVYSFGGGTLTHTMTGGGYYLVKGKIVDATLVRFQALGLTPKAFTASRWTHFYLKADGEVVVEVVMPGVAATPDGTRIHVGTAKANGVQVTAWEDGVREPPRVWPVWGFEQGLRIHNLDQDVRGLEFYMEGSQAWRLKHYGDFGNTTLAVETDTGGGYTPIFSFGNTTTPMSFTRRISSTFNSGTDPLVFLTQTAANSRTMHLKLTGAGGTVLKLENAGGTGSPLVLVPKSAVTVADEIGSMHPEFGSRGDMMYRDVNGDVRRFWATAMGIRYDSAPVVGPGSIAVSTNVFSSSMSFTNGRKYWVFAHVRLGRPAGSTRDASVTGTIGGANMWWSPHTVQLFQGGGAPWQFEQSFSMVALWTANVPAPLSIVLNVTPVNGAGNVFWGYAAMHVFGALD